MLFLYLPPVFQNLGTSAIDITQLLFETFFVGGIGSLSPFQSQFLLLCSGPLYHMCVLESSPRCIITATG